MSFVGNSPIAFKNIKSYSFASSQKLANLLREHDIYITASKNEPCSNAFLEAIHCGLPTVALKSGCYPEMTGSFGELFSGTSDVISQIDRVSQSINTYTKNRAQMHIASIEDILKEYVSFFKKVLADKDSRPDYPSKWYLYMYYCMWKVRMKLWNMCVYSWKQKRS